MPAKRKVAIQKTAQSNSIFLPRGTLHWSNLPNNFCLLFSSLENEDKMRRLLFPVLRSQGSLDLFLSHCFCCFLFSSWTETTLVVKNFSALLDYQKNS